MENAFTECNNLPGVFRPLRPRFLSIPSAIRRKIVIGLFAAAAIIGILASGSARAAPPDCFSPPNTWVLLGLDVHMGAVTMRGQ
jgi:hypothetical protein